MSKQTDAHTKSRHTVSPSPVTRAQMSPECTHILFQSTLVIDLNWSENNRTTFSLWYVEPFSKTKNSAKLYILCHCLVIFWIYPFALVEWFPQYCLAHAAYRKHQNYIISDSCCCLKHLQTRGHREVKNKPMGILPEVVKKKKVADKSQPVAIASCWSEWSIVHACMNLFPSLFIFPIFIILSEQCNKIRT